MERRGAKGWLGDLEAPDMMRRLEILSAFPEHKITREAQKRLVRAANPRPKERRPCHVCDRHRAISQSHHVIEIGKVVGVLNTFAIFDWAPRIPIVSLCPNHHAYEHVIRRLKAEVSQEFKDALRAELSDRDWDKLFEVDDLRLEAHENLWREIREEFLRREAAYQRT